jgi:hypothetical protein
MAIKTEVKEVNKTTDQYALTITGSSKEISAVIDQIKKGLDDIVKAAALSEKDNSGFEIVLSESELRY